MLEYINLLYRQKLFEHPKHVIRTHAARKQLRHGGSDASTDVCEGKMRSAPTVRGCSNNMF